jgi:AP-1-like factor
MLQTVEFFIRPWERLANPYQHLLSTLLTFLADSQQAFRKRKEIFVKDLKTKLASLEAAQQQVLAENEHLKQNLHKISTENEILRATSQISGEDLYSLEPATFNAAKFYAKLFPNQNVKNPSRSIITGDGERLLDAGAAWDFIINHQLFEKGLVDI